jgi:hypothetical protein
MTWPWASPHTVRVWTIDWKPAVSPRGVCKENFAAGKLLTSLRVVGRTLSLRDPAWHWQDSTCWQVRTPPQLTLQPPSYLTQACDAHPNPLQSWLARQLQVRGSEGFQRPSAPVLHSQCPSSHCLVNPRTSCNLFSTCLPSFTLSLIVHHTD